MAAACRTQTEGRKLRCGPPSHPKIGSRSCASFPCHSYILGVDCALRADLATTVYTEDLARQWSQALSPSVLWYPFSILKKSMIKCYFSGSRCRIPNKGKPERGAWEPDVLESNRIVRTAQVSLRTLLVQCQRAVHLGVCRLRFR